MRKLLLPLLAATAITFLSAGCSANDDYSEIPVIPVHLVGIEAVNVDNSGEFPFITTGPVSKEAFMIGIKWESDDSDPGGDQSITPPISNYDPTGRSDRLSAYFVKRIYCVSQFNARNPAGSNISQYFKQVDYLPAGLNEGFVLLVAPDPGAHSFRVVYTSEEEIFEFITQPIDFY